MGHHPQALFSLIPSNQRTYQVLEYSENKHLVALHDDGRAGLDVGHMHSKSGSTTTLATLGRDGDIIVKGPSISKIQCSFEINSSTNVVMFYDRSHTQTSRVYGDDARTVPFEYPRPRKVVVQQNLNCYIGFGGEKRDQFQFELKWYQDAEATIDKAKIRGGTSLVENPNLAETIDEAETVVPSKRETRLHTKGEPKSQKIRWAQVNRLGTGQYGQVLKVVNVDTGNLLAVKILKLPSAEAVTESRRAKWRKEIDNLANAKHKHIVQYIATQNYENDAPEIFMELREGTLVSFMDEVEPSLRPEGVATACDHILQAIDFLAVRKIIHRDIKPQNILYYMESGLCQFQLCDFGLSTTEAEASGCAGSQLYMAPEIWKGGKQTHKADVWSLFVTLLWMTGREDVRTLLESKLVWDDQYDSVLELAWSEDSVSHILEMGSIEPQERASAAQMLRKCYSSRGLSTPQNQVPPLKRIKPPRPLTPLGTLGAQSGPPDDSRSQPNTPRNRTESTLSYARHGSTPATQS
ncbi:kinase-like domain-containing protein [Xylaria palmicola]|nr:kinase-like domain-containing protein [Xylaria palmicola]